jgi:hypothetical protein
MPIFEDLYLMARPWSDRIVAKRLAAFAAFPLRISTPWAVGGVTREDCYSERGHGDQLKRLVRSQACDSPLLQIFSNLVFLKTEVLYLQEDSAQ